MRERLAVAGGEPRADGDPAGKLDRPRLDGPRALHDAALPELVEPEGEREREAPAPKDADDDVLLARPRVLGPVHRARPDVLGVPDAELVVHQIRDPGNAAGLDGQCLDRLRSRLGRRRHGDRARVVDVVREPDADAPLVCREQRGENERPRLGLEADVVERQVEALASVVQERRDLGGDARGGLPAVGERGQLDGRAHRPPRYAPPAPKRKRSACSAPLFRRSSKEDGAPREGLEGEGDARREAVRQAPAATRDRTSRARGIPAVSACCGSSRSPG